jgi:hypothetical protein
MIASVFGAKTVTPGALAAESLSSAPVGDLPYAPRNGVGRDELQARGHQATMP